MPLAASRTRGVGRAEFDLAAPADDAEVRRLFRENPMGGAVRLSLEREPDASWAAAVEGDTHQAVVARRPGGGLCAVGTRSVRTAYVNGVATRLGYLGGLRVDADCRGDPRVLLGGYDRLRELHEAEGDARLYLTSIVADNAPARRVLEAGLRGMPTYRYMGEFVTVVMRVRRPREMLYYPSTNARRSLRRLGLALKHASAGTRDAVGRLLRAEARGRQFAAEWTADTLASPSACRGLVGEDFRVAQDAEGEIVGCAALWDQRSFKQAVVRGYGPPLDRCRAVVNAVAAVIGRPRLPDVGRPLRAGYVSHVAGPPDVVVSLVEAVHAMAGTRSLDYVMIGFGGDDPRLAGVRRAFGGRELRTRLYVVHWPDGAAAAAALDGRPVGPEAAVL